MMTAITMPEMTDSCHDEVACTGQRLSCYTLHPIKSSRTGQVLRYAFWVHGRIKKHARMAKKERETGERAGRQR